MTSSLNHHRASQKRFARTFILQFLIVAIAAVAMLACMPSHAYAKSYTCPSVTIDAQANADGSLDVTETRTFDFSGNFTAVWWTFDNMPTKESMLSVKSVSLTNESTGEIQTLSPVEFQRAWREAGGAGYPSYSIDEDENTVYVFFDESDSEVTMTLSYSISNFVQVYDDVAEVYWQYIGHGWAVDSDHVATTLTVPVAAGAQVRAGDNVRAWGHGPLDGSLSIGDDGAIYAQVSSVSAGGYAEIHSVFPAEWMNVSGSAANKHMGNRLDSVLEDEAQLANKANASRLQSLLFIVVCLVAAIGIIVWAVFMFFRHGREYKPITTSRAFLAGKKRSSTLLIKRRWTSYSRKLPRVPIPCGLALFSSSEPITLSRSTTLWKAGRAWFRLKRTSATSSRKKVRTIA